MAAKIQRGTCPTCRTAQKLTAQGTIDHHRRGRLREACPGNWKPPTPAVRQTLVDHERPLPASVVGRGTVGMTPGEIAAAWAGPATNYGIGRSADVAERLDRRLR